MIDIIAKNYNEVNINMKQILALCQVIVKKIVIPGIFDITIDAPEIAGIALPGQFLHIKCGNFILRRPISICDVNGDSIRFLFDVRGDGTEWLSNINVNDYIDVLGPLGTGFEMLPSDKKAVFIGGGIGIYPLLYASKLYNNPTVLLGFRSKSVITLIEDFEKNGANIKIATDDGSYGHHGYVPDLLNHHLLDSSDTDIVYTCGPKLMMKIVAEIANNHNIRCQVSMEERMGCGVGACLVCACKTYKNDGAITHSFVCKDGPVYEANKVVW